MKCKGSWAPIRNKIGDIIAESIRSKDNCKPIFISVGHLTNLLQAIEWTLKITTAYRIPEPTRLAHNLLTNYRQNNIPRFY